MKENHDGLTQLEAGSHGKWPTRGLPLGTDQGKHSIPGDIADYIAHDQAKKLFLWLSRNEHSPLVARHIKFHTFVWASAIESAIACLQRLLCL